jgi:hypothetical protein
MTDLRYTLLAEGSSDRALLPVLTWLLRRHGVARPIQPQWANLHYLPAPPRTLAARIARAVDLYPCDLLFVHRDADREPRARRLQEIAAALLDCAGIPPVVCVVPVRMQETWLLVDEQAIRQAAGNPHGQDPLALPPLGSLEQLPDPKTTLHRLLQDASGLHGRRRKEVPVRVYAARIMEPIADFTPLQELPAFAALDADIAAIVQAQGWDH